MQARGGRAAQACETSLGAPDVQKARVSASRTNASGEGTPCSMQNATPADPSTDHPLSSEEGENGCGRGKCTGVERTAYIVREETHDAACLPCFPSSSTLSVRKEASKC